MTCVLAGAGSAVGEKVALSRAIEKHWRLIGCGTVTAGVPMEVAPQDEHGTEDEHEHEDEKAPMATATVVAAAAPATADASETGGNTSASGCVAKVELKASPVFVLSATHTDENTAMAALHGTLSEKDMSIQLLQIAPVLGHIYDVYVAWRRSH